MYNKEKISQFFKIIDEPDNNRKIHSKPTPLLGGLIILIVILLNFYYFNLYLPYKELIILSLLVLFYFILSYIDDVKGLNSYFRLIFLFCVTYFLLSFSDLFIIKNLIFNYKNINFNLGFLNIFISTLCILLLVNALNLSDGINGLSTLLIIFWLVYIKFILFNDYSFVGISAIIFLTIVFYHIFKGAYFMGDYGVTVAALFIGLMSIASYNVQLDGFNKIYVEELFLMFFIPGLDMFRLFIERALQKKDPFSADKNHLHHILIGSFGLKKSLAIYLLISFVPILFYKMLEFNSLILIITYSTLYFLIFSTKLKNIFKK